MIRRIAILVDEGKCFDLLHKTGGDLSPVASRLSVPFLTGEFPPFIDAIGLAAYGISVDGIEVVKDAGDQPSVATETSEPVAPVVPATLNEWFMTLPPERQKMLREDKWMLAEAAWKAGSERTGS